MRICHALDRFGLKENFIPDNEVCVIKVRQNDSFVADLITFLARERNSGSAQFNNKSVLVDDFVVTLSQLAMNLESRSYELINLLLVKQFLHLNINYTNRPKPRITKQFVAVREIRV